MATLAIAGSAQAALAPGTPLKTLMAGNGNRYFGSDMTGDLLSNSTVTQLQAQQFSMLTPGNEMKWVNTEPSQNNFTFAAGDSIVQYAHANGERYRGHNLVWDSQLAGWVTQLPLSQVQAAMENHITKEVSHYATVTSTMPQTPYAWDVVNEPFNDDGSFKADVFFNAMGSGYIADALKTAHNADPNAKLYLNDFNIEGMNAKSNAMFSLAQSLLAAGVPLNGIGFESHFILGQIPSDMQANMQRFANLGLDVAVTELDVRINLPSTAANLQTQATNFAAVVKDCLGVTRCVGVTQWAVGDKDSWVPGFFTNPPQGDATMFDMSYNPKPAFTAVQNAIGPAGNVITVTQPPNQSTTVNTAASLQIQASDSAAGQTLTYSAANLPTGLTINGSTGLISGTPTATGTFSVTVTVKDTTNASGSTTFTWTVKPVGGNTVTVTNPGTHTGTVGTATSLQVAATDSQAGQTLTFTAANLPAGLTISSSGLISGTPSTAANNTVTVTATDTTGASGSASFAFNISGGTTGTCHVVYTRNSEWPGNFTAQVVIGNTGTATLNGWTLTFTYPGDQKITQNFNGGFSMSGENATITPANYNSTIAAGASVTVGFQGTFTSNDTSPTSFKINGTACS
jgi:endo-1,4-beta-xylanase